MPRPNQRTPLGVTDLFAATERHRVRVHLADGADRLGRRGTGLPVLDGEVPGRQRDRLANPGHLIDINPLEPELSYIRQEGDEVAIGAMTRHVNMLESDLLQRLFPIFFEAEHVLADPVVRNRGTMGGSLCQADPAEDLSGVVTALKGEAVLKGPGGATRRVGMEEFHVGPYMTAVQPGELLIEVRFKVKPGHGSAHEKVERRAGDFAIVAASAALWIQNGRIAV